MAKDDRTYLATTPDNIPMFIEDAGNRLQISGVLMTGEGSNILLMLPGLGGRMMWGITTEIELTPEQWAAVIKYSDDPVFFTDHPEGKVMHRKAERQVSGFVQQQIWARDGFECQYCGRSMGEVQLSIDHFVPLELGGANDTSNYVSACKKCNKDKGSIPPKEFCDKLDPELYESLVEYLGGFKNNGM